MYDIRLAAISGTVTILKILFDQRLLTKYLTKLPGLPSRLGSLRGSRVPAHLKKHKHSHVHQTKTRLQCFNLQFCRLTINTRKQYFYRQV